MIPIHFQILNASYCRVLKNEEHYDEIFKILSYSALYKRGPKLVRDTLSAFSRRRGQCWFGLGLFRYVVSELKKKNISYKIIYECEQPTNLEVKSDIIIKDIELEKYQAKSISILNEKIKRGIFQAPTGSGKTIYEAAIIKKLGIPKTLIITPNKSICNQTMKSLSKTINREIGIIGQGQRNWKRVSVSLYQTLDRMIEDKTIEILANEIDLILWDECHLAIENVANILSYFKNTWYRFGFTATPFPKNKKKEWLMTTAQIGEIISKTTEKETVKRIIDDIEVYMFYFFDNITRNDFMNIYRYDLLRNEQRCALLLKMVKFGFDKGYKNCLLLVDEMEQAKIIKEFSYFYEEKYMHPVIAWKDTDNELIKKKFIEGKIPFCVATPVFSVGTDIPNVEHICLGSARKSKSNLLQKLGRGRRRTENKDKLLVTDVFDEIANEEKVYFYDFSLSRMKFYKLKRWFKGVYVENEKGEWVSYDGYFA